MPQSATIKSLPRAFRMMKAMQAQGIEWGEDYRQAGRAALKDVLEGRMAAGIDRHLVEMAERGAADRVAKESPSRSCWGYRWYVKIATGCRLGHGRPRAPMSPRADSAMPLLTGLSFGPVPGYESACSFLDEHAI